jgi:hypothetical protein
MHHSIEADFSPRTKPDPERERAITHTNRLATHAPIVDRQPSEWSETQDRQGPRDHRMSRVQPQVQYGGLDREHHHRRTVSQERLLTMSPDKVSPIFPTVH